MLDTRQLALMVIVFGFALAAAAGGPLAPPAAPADGVMKTLEEIEPRIPISSLPYTITEEGSYYLTGNLSLATPDTHGIAINASNVTIDLCGFTLRGPGKDVGFSGSGIYCSDPYTNIAVRNGTVTAWAYNGIGIFCNRGIMENLRCIDNGSYGLYASSSYVIRNNVCIGNDSSGIGASCGNNLYGNACSSNGASGITAGDGNTITNNTCYENHHRGIIAEDGSTLIGNSCSDNVAQGIVAQTGSTITGNSCSGNGTHGIYVTEYSSPRSTGCAIRGNACSKNAGCGINGDIGSLIEQNTCTENGEDGILAISNCRIRDNLCDRNGQVETGAGIHVESGENAIEGNTVMRAQTGILVDDAGNYIASNRASGNTTDYDIAASNTEGSGDLANVSY